jgi:lambda family phage portal protein
VGCHSPTAKQNCARVTVTGDIEAADVLEQGASLMAKTSLRYRLATSVAPELTRRAQNFAARQTMRVLRRLPDATVRQIGTALRGWAGAAEGPRRNIGHSSTAPVNADLARDLPALQAHGQHIYRNTPHGYRITEELALSVIGTGIYPRIRTANKSLTKKQRRDRNRYLQAHFDEFARTCWPASPSGFYGLQDVAYREAEAIGEILIRKQYHPTKRFGGVPLFLSLIPTRLLSRMHDTTGKRKDGTEIINGIEYAADGTIAAYWLLKSDAKAKMTSTFEAERVPADEIMHLMFPLQSGQNRGVPRTAPIMDAIRDEEEYNESLLTRKAAENSIVAFITGIDASEDLTGASLGGASSPLAALDSDGGTVSQMQPAQIVMVPNGKDVKLSAPSSQYDLKEFADVQHHRYSAGSGVPYSRLTGDITGASFSGERVGMLPFRRLVQVRQQTWVKPLMVEPIYEAWADMALLYGIADWSDFDDLGHLPASYVYPVVEEADIKTAVEVDTMRVRGGFKTQRDIIINAGDDPDDIIEGRQDENEDWDAAGVVTTTDPRRYASTGNPVTAPAAP